LTFFSDRIIKLISLPHGTQTRGGRGHLMYPSKDFKKFGQKNALKHENRGPLDFLITPNTPSKEFND
jgi:hypothetical protein